MKCANCGFEGNKPNQKTCTLCGEPLIDQVEKPEVKPELPTPVDETPNSEEHLRPTPEQEQLVHFEPAQEELVPAFEPEPLVEEAPVELKGKRVSAPPLSDQPLTGSGDEPTPAFDPIANEMVYNYEDDNPPVHGDTGGSSSLASDTPYDAEPAPPSSTTGGASWLLYLLATIVSLAAGVGLYMATN